MELILSIVALTKGLYTVVASSLIGSILSNLLLVLGEQTFYDIFENHNFQYWERPHLCPACHVHVSVRRGSGAAFCHMQQRRALRAVRHAVACLFVHHAACYLRSVPRPRNLHGYLQWSTLWGMSTRPAASTPSPYPLHTSSPACHCLCTTQPFTSLVRCSLHGQSQATAPHCFGSLSHVRPLLHPPTHASHLPAGCCFLVGGARYKTQSFSVAINKASCSLLFLAAIALVIPTAAPALYSTDNLSEQAVITLSHTTAIILILL